MCVLGGEDVASVLDTEHHKRLGAVVADATLTGRSHTDNGTLLNREYIAVDLELAFA